MSVASALESSATQFDHESVTASCCDAVSLSHTSVPKVSPVKLKVASPRPKRWPKHSTTTVIASPQGGDTTGGQDLLENIPEISDKFQILSKIGEGTFSSVYLASLKDCPEERFALKHLVPTSSSSRIENELRCLKMMGGRDNVISIHTCVRHRDHIVLIMPYFPHDRFADYLPHMTVSEARDYMRALFLALRNVHSHHIIHRDIKPSNFLYNRARKEFELVDFGLAHLEPGKQALEIDKGWTPQVSGVPRLKHRSKRAVDAPSKQPRVVIANGLIPPHTYQRQVHHRMAAKAVKQSGSGGRLRSTAAKQNGGGEMDGHDGGGGTSQEIRLCPLRHKVTEVCDFCSGRSNQNAPRAGTPGFRAPEVLLKCPHQTTAVDMWSAGVILLCILSGRYPFFRAHDDLTAMAQIISLRGSRECIEAARSCGKELVCVPDVQPINLKELCVRLRAPLSHPRQSPDSDFEPSPVKKMRLCNGESNPTDHRHSSSGSKPPNRKCPRRGTNPLGSDAFHTKSDRSAGSLSSTNSSSQESTEVQPSWDDLPDSAFNLLYRCLDLNPATRITADEALKHPFIINQR